MAAFRKHLIRADGDMKCAGAGLSVGVALLRTAAGDPLDVTFAGDVVGLAAAVAWHFLNEDDAVEWGLPLIQEESSYPALAREIRGQLLEGVAPRAMRLALTAGLLQAVDDWEASHEAAQEADDLGEERFSAYWHGIAHRREPDAGNASYWFRRVGEHPLFPALAEASRPILDEHGDRALADRLAGAGGWDPYAMIELCTRATRGSDRERLARRLQRLEMALLLEATAEAVADR